MEKQVEWTLSNGAKATYTVVELCNEVIQSVTVEGIGHVAPYIDILSVPRVIDGTTIVASIGDKIGITEETYNRIKEAANEVLPKWKEGDDASYPRSVPMVGSCY